MARLDHTMHGAASDELVVKLAIIINCQFTFASGLWISAQKLSIIYFGLDIIKLSLPKAALRMDAVHLFLGLFVFVCWSFLKCVQKRYFIKNKQFRAMVSIDDQREVLLRYYIIGMLPV